MFEKEGTEKLKRVVTGAAAAGLALSLMFLLPGKVLAGTSASGVGAKEKAGVIIPAGIKAVEPSERQYAVSLEQAVVIAKEAFPVPEDFFDQFSTGFSRSEGRSFWELRWSRSKEPGGYMNVMVNAETGEIWSMNRWVPETPGRENHGLPRYTREQAEGIAAAMAKKLQPERFRQTRLQPGGDYYPVPLLQARGPVIYSYDFARVVNGVTYPENGINVSVSGDTGEVTGFGLNWEEIAEFPPATGCITPSQAGQAFRSEAAPELEYFRPGIPGGREVPLKLVYRLPEQNGEVLIDAFTGKLLKRDESNYYIYPGGGGGDEHMKFARDLTSLSPVEEVAVEEAKKLLPVEKALQAAMSAVKIPAGYILNSSRLEQDYMFKDKKTWNFSWCADDEQENGAGQKWLSVGVDAATGELVSFNAGRYRPLYVLKPEEVKYGEDAARRIAEEFIKKVQPAKWGQTAFRFCRPEMFADPAGKPLPGLYVFNWVRLSGGAKFPANGFYVSVESSTGEIVSYRMDWWDVEFPAQAGIMNREEAANRYLQEAPLTLAYVRAGSRDGLAGSGKNAMKLVYRLSRRDFAMLDAFTGLPLDFQGEIVTKHKGVEKFTDLEGHPAREAVELLAGAGVVAGDNGKFRPDDVITQAELIAMLVKSQRPDREYRAGAAAGKEPWYQRYYDMAASMGIIQYGEKPNPDAPVSREFLARLTVHALGLYQAARLGDIYLLNFADAGEIADHLRGHVAISAGLGLIEPLEGKFMPKAPVTRAEAAVTLVKLLKCVR